MKNPDIVKFFQKEIQNMILLRNEKNIVKIVDVYKLEENSKFIFYIIMEFCENGNLDDFIKNKKIPDKENLRDKIAYQIINVVYSCHKERIAHRDLKPQNIFLDKDWNVKLGDFGVSDKFRYRGKDSSRCGTLTYMCYEKILGREHNPFKADLYSLGVILYELYTQLLYVKVESMIIYKEGKKKFRKEFIYNFYKNENVERNLDEKLDDEKLDDENYYNLKILLTGLLQQFEGNRWGWNNIFDSEFYKELNDKYKE